MKRTNLTVVLLALLSGMLGALLVVRWDRAGAALPGAAVAATRPGNVVSASEIRLVDASGRVRAQLTLVEGGNPALFFFDQEGRNRMNLGLYAPAEGEFPFVVLNDTHQHAAGIFRLFGQRESPVVVLKNEGQDRSIYGLNPASSEPFLVNIGSGGSKAHVFGNF